jgi:hypothetical protein
VTPRIGTEEPTVECQSNKLQAHVTKSNIQTCSQSTRSNACEIESSCHERFLGFLLMLQLICIRDMGIMRIRKGVVSRAELWKNEEDKGCERELD